MSYKVWINRAGALTNPHAITQVNGITYPRGTVLNYPEAVSYLGLREIDVEDNPPLDYTPDTYYRQEPTSAPYKVVYTPKSQEQIETVTVQKYVVALESHYDSVAQQRNYDNRLTCALRAGYSGPFQTEGDKFGKWMDECNIYAYTELEKMKKGLRQPPADAQAFVEELPKFTW